MSFLYIYESIFQKLLRLSIISKEISIQLYQTVIQTTIKNNNCSKMSQVPPDQQQLLAILTKGIEQQNSQKYAQAQKCYLQVLARRPTSQNMPIHISRLYRKQKRYQESEKYGLKAIEINPKFIDGYLELCKLYQDMHRDNDAVDMYQKMIQIQPNNVDVWFDFGLKKFQMGDQQEAKGYFEKVIELDPKSDTALHNLAIILGNDNQLQKALFYTEKALQITPNSANYLSYFGKIKILQQKYQQALIWLNKAIEIDANYQNAHQYKSVAFQKMGKYQNAEQELQLLIKINPNNDKTYFDFGKVKAKLGKTKEAFDLFRKCLEINPKHMNCLNQYSNLLEKQNEGKIEELANRMLKQDNDLSKSVAYLLLGRQAQEKNERQAAIQFYKKALQINQFIIECYSNIGFIYLLINEYQQSEKYYLKGQSLDSSYINYNLIIFHLGVINLCIGKLYTAQNYFLKAQKMNVQTATLYEYLGDLYRFQSENQKAEQCYQKSIAILQKKQDKSGNDFHQFGDVYKKQGKISKAKDMYLKSTELNPQQTRSFFNLCQIYYDDKDYQKGLKQCNIFLDSQPDNILMMVVKVNFLYALQKQFQAYTLFDDILQKYSLEDFEKREFLYRLDDAIRQNVDYIKQKMSMFKNLRQLTKQQFFNNKDGQKIISKAIKLVFENLKKQEGKKPKMQQAKQQRELNQQLQKKIKEAEQRLQKLQKATNIEQRIQFNKLQKQQPKLAAYYRELVISICVCVDSYRALKTGIFEPGDQPIKSTVGKAMSFLKGAASLAEKIPLIDKFASMVGAVGKIYLGLQTQYIADQIIGRFQTYVSRQQLTNQIIGLALKLSKIPKFTKLLLQPNTDVPWYEAIKQKFDSLIQQTKQVKDQILNEVTGFGGYKISKFENIARQHCVQFLIIMINTKYVSRFRYSNDLMETTLEIFLQQKIGEEQSQSQKGNNQKITKQQPPKNSAEVKNKEQNPTALKNLSTSNQNTNIGSTENKNNIVQKQLGSKKVVQTSVGCQPCVIM